MSQPNYQQSPEQAQLLSQENAAHQNLFYPPMDQHIAVMDNQDTINNHLQNCSAPANRAVHTKRRAKRDDGRPKRDRHNYTEDEIAMLEDYYKTSQFISKSARSKLAERLNVSDRRVKIWFQNRRVRAKRQSKAKQQLDTEVDQAFSPASLSSNASTPLPGHWQQYQSTECATNNTETHFDVMQYRNYFFEPIQSPIIPQQSAALYQPYYITYPVDPMETYSARSHPLSVTDTSSVDDHTANDVRFKEKDYVELGEFDLQLNCSANSLPPINFDNLELFNDINVECEQPQHELQPDSYHDFREDGNYQTATSNDITTYWRQFNTE